MCVNVLSYRECLLLRDAAVLGMLVIEHSSSGQQRVKCFSHIRCQSLVDLWGLTQRVCLGEAGAVLHDNSSMTQRRLSCMLVKSSFPSEQRIVFLFIMFIWQTAGSLKHTSTSTLSVDRANLHAWILAVRKHRLLNIWTIPLRQKENLITHVNTLNESPFLAVIFKSLSKYFADSLSL